MFAWTISTTCMTFFIVVPLRSDRERGLHERAVRSGVAFPCKVSSITIPLKLEADSESYELVQWPILLPEDFVFSALL